MDRKYRSSILVLFLSFCNTVISARQMLFLCESEASATNAFSVRKRSVSNKCFFCAKAKRQRQSA
ncbi:hypothetical protein [Lysinibacillus sp. G4S2]|uniref:hypothetical protein n=1 Tax=Lysinibacillus sp. G4S2 TaxID=3055859 RepID=UPI0025A1FF67|nr:hypothetical protein [Lysinibacillus sp. G4S2]MDM5250267.1 hypothetical protein [Lysinibacillus sp. G4S2]